MSCTSSDRLISPPENPALMSRSRKSVKFILAAMPATSTSRPPAQIWIICRVLSPLTVGGRWYDMPMPSRARSLMGRFVMSTPLKVIFPAVTRYCG